MFFCFCFHAHSTHELIDVRFVFVQILFCPTCEETYKLPQNGNIKDNQEQVCPLDGYELVLYTTGSGTGVSYPLCPRCYSAPPFEDFEESLMPCTHCLHPTCAHSPAKNGVKDCSECEKGRIIFDPRSGPRWKMTCNTCQNQIQFIDGIHKMTALKDLCPECNARLFRFDFHKDKNPLKDGILLIEKACIFCDERISELTLQRIARKVHPMFRRGG
jgi:DNA topoisomerase III